MYVINRDGKMSYADIMVGVSDGMTIEASWVVRLIGHDGLRKIVVGEEPFETEPNDGQIMYCLAKYLTADFAVVEKIYKLDNHDLPFE